MGFVLFYSAPIPLYACITSEQDFTHMAVETGNKCTEYDLSTLIIAAENAIFHAFSTQNVTKSPKHTLLMFKHNCYLSCL